MIVPSLQSLNPHRQAQFVREFCNQPNAADRQTPQVLVEIHKIMQSEAVKEILGPSDIERVNVEVRQYNKKEGYEALEEIAISKRVAAAALPVIGSVNPIAKQEQIAAAYRQIAMQIQGTVVGDQAGFGNQFIEGCRNTAELAECMEDVVEALKTGTYKGGRMRMSGGSVFYILTALAISRCQKEGLVSSREVLNECLKLYLQYTLPSLDRHSHQRGYGFTLQESLKIVIPKLIGEIQGVKAEMSLMEAIGQIGDAPILIQNSFRRESQGCSAAIRTGIFAWLEKLGIVRDEQEFLNIVLANAIATHPNPIGFLGGLISPIFIRKALDNQPIRQWVPEVCENLEFFGGRNQIARRYIMCKGPEVDFYRFDWQAVQSRWEQYKKNIDTHEDTPEEHERVRFVYALPQGWNPQTDQEYEAQIAMPLNAKNSWPGIKGHDAPLLAFHAVYTVCKRLASCLDKKFDPETTPEMIRDWLKEAPEMVEVANRWLFEIACLHGGNSSSTGAIALQLWVAIAQEYALIKDFTQHSEQIPAQKLLPGAMQASHFLIGGIEEGGGGAAPALQVRKLKTFHDLTGPKHKELRVIESVAGTLKHNFLHGEDDPIFFVEFVANVMSIYCSNRGFAQKIADHFGFDYESIEGLHIFNIKTTSKEFWDVMQQSGLQLDQVLLGKQVQEYVFLDPNVTEVYVPPKGESKPSLAKK